MILESLNQEGIFIKPDSKNFLDYIFKNSTRSVPKNLTLAEPSYDYVYGQSIYNFMTENGLSPQKRFDVMKEILGFEKPCYLPKFN